MEPEFWEIDTSCSGKVVVEVIGWSKNDVIIEDVKSGVQLAMNWDIFMEKFRKLEYKGGKISTYEGPNLDLKNRGF